MAEKRDLLDDIIDIQSDWRAVANPFGDVMNSLAADPDKVRVWNPADYKERPRTNPVFCINSTTKREGLCQLCTSVCPVDAIDLSGGKVSIRDDCRKCGLCGVACPTDVFGFVRTGQKALYDRVARVAGAYEHCYVTCTRALGRLPEANEVVLPCVGSMSAELWFALLTEYDNVSVYLPLGICDRCRTTTGEEMYAGEISEAEELSDAAVGLEVDEADLTHELTRAYKRSQFVSGMAQAGANLATRGVPVLAGAKAVSERIKAHTKQLSDLQRQLERALGEKTAQSRRRILTTRRRLVMAALQRSPELAGRFVLEVPTCDRSLCTMCGDCVRACPVHACELDGGGRFAVEPSYCVNCGACAAVCPEDALTMEARDAQELVVGDPEAERAQVRRARAAEARERAVRGARRALDTLERLDDSAQ